MSIIRSYFDGIGTGAGVAWPSFGIVASVLSAGVGGALAITLGTICCFIFLAVSIPVFYLSYKKVSLEEKQLNDKVNLNLARFLENFYQHYSCGGEAGKSPFLDYLNEWLNNATLHGHFLTHINATDKDFFNNYLSFSETEKKKQLETFIHTYIDSVNIHSPPINERASTAFLNFVGVFGSVAGCSAGIMGVISGLGILSGFGAIPLAGAAVLLLAVGLGVYSAAHAVESMIEKNKKNKIYKHFKQFNKKFEARELSVIEAKVCKAAGDGAGLTEPAVYHAESSRTLFTSRRASEDRLLSTSTRSLIPGQ